MGRFPHERLSVSCFRQPDLYERAQGFTAKTLQRMICEKLLSVAVAKFAGHEAPTPALAEELLQKRIMEGDVIKWLEINH
jgi:hypothetical protein